MKKTEVAAIVKDKRGEGEKGKELKVVGGEGGGEG